MHATRGRPGRFDRARAILQRRVAVGIVDAVKPGRGVIDKNVAADFDPVEAATAGSAEQIVGPALAGVYVRDTALRVHDDFRGRGGWSQSDLQIINRGPRRSLERDVRHLTEPSGQFTTDSTWVGFPLIRINAGSGA